MYPDNELVTCPVCGQLGDTFPDLWGKIQFFHKVPSKTEGYFTFTESHLVGVSA